MTVEKTSNVFKTWKTTSFLNATKKKRTGNMKCGACKEKIYDGEIYLRVEHRINGRRNTHFREILCKKCFLHPK